MDPLTLSTLAISGIASLAQSGLGAAAAGVVGNISDRLFMRTVEATRDRVKGLKGVPENHHVARSVRLAQIAALRQVMQSYRSRHNSSTSENEAFIAAALAFCDSELKALRQGQKLEIEVTKTLSRSINSILTGGSSADAVKDRADRLRRMSEDAVLAELASAVGVSGDQPGCGLPGDFVEHFLAGGPASDPFMELFGAFIADELKQKTEFYRVYTTGQMAEVREAVESIEVRFGPMLEQIHHEVVDLHAGFERGHHEVMSKLEEIASRTRRIRGLPATIEDMAWDRADSFFDTCWGKMLDRWKAGGLDYIEGVATPEVPQRVTSWLCEVAETRAGIDQALVVASNLRRARDEVASALRARAFSEIERVYARIHMICVLSGVVEVRTAYASAPMEISDEAPVLAEADSRVANADLLRREFEARLDEEKERARAEAQRIAQPLFKSWVDKANASATRNYLNYIISKNPVMASLGGPAPSTLRKFFGYLSNYDGGEGDRQEFKHLFDYTMRKTMPDIFNKPEVLPRDVEVAQEILEILDEMYPQDDIHALLKAYKLGPVNPLVQPSAELLDMLIDFTMSEYDKSYFVQRSKVTIERAQLTQALQRAKSRAREVLTQPARHEWVREFR